MVLYPMNEMLAHIESRYLLVNMVAHRARRSPRRRKGVHLLEEKPVTMALEEAAQRRAPSGRAHRIF